MNASNGGWLYMAFSEAQTISISGLGSLLYYCLIKYKLQRNTGTIKTGGIKNCLTF